MPFASLRSQALSEKRAALYARVSTEEQAMRGVSLDAQKERLFSFAREVRFLLLRTVFIRGKNFPLSPPILA